MSNQHNLIQFPESVNMKACEWVAKLDRGDLSASEKQALNGWLKQDPMHREALAEQLNQWSDMDVLSELANLSLDLDESLTWAERLGSFFSFNHPMPYIAAVLSGLLILSLVSIMPFESETSFEVVDIDISTQIGEQASEALPDGSVLHLNTTSLAQVSYTEEQRSVELRAGEVFVDVAHDAERPFVVYAGNTQVRAIGTAFAVHMIDGAIEVSVTEGTVEFESGGSRHIVSAENTVQDSLGNFAIYSNDQTTIDNKPKDVLSRRLAWQSGMLEFRGETLDFVVNELSRYTEAKIEIADDEIKDIRMGGYFKIGDLEGLASTLELGFNLEVAVISDNLIQISRGTDD